MINPLLNIVLVVDGLPIVSDGKGGIQFHLDSVSTPAYGSYGEDFVKMIENGIDGWIAVKGFSHSGSDSFIMHPSEVIGNALENHILDTPGYYAIETIPSEDEDDYDVGWVLMHKEL